jgi:hypothetical protein
VEDELERMRQEDQRKSEEMRRPHDFFRSFVPQQQDMMKVCYEAYFFCLNEQFINN